MVLFKCFDHSDLPYCFVLRNSDFAFCPGLAQYNGRAIFQEICETQHYVFAAKTQFSLAPVGNRATRVRRDRTPGTFSPHWECREKAESLG